MVDRPRRSRQHPGLRRGSGRRHVSAVVPGYHCEGVGDHWRQASAPTTATCRRHVTDQKLSQSRQSCRCLVEKANLHICLSIQLD